MARQSACVQYTPEQVWPIFECWLPHEMVANLLAQVTQRSYRRLFPPLVVLWGFITNGCKPTAPVMPSSVI